MLDPEALAELAARLGDSDDAELRRRAGWRTPSHQSTLALTEYAGRSYVVKAPRGGGLIRLLTAWLIRREYRIYRQLVNMPGAPECAGLLPGSRLVLEFKNGRALRDADIADRQAYFADLLDILKRMHARGIAHGDLKNKDNILVLADGGACVIDYGIAIRYKPGFHPINHALFRLAQRLDFNAWVKHKYRRHVEHITPEDAVYWQRSRLEDIWYRVRNRIQRMRGHATSRKP